jgi:hypothetical protein
MHRRPGRCLFIPHQFTCFAPSKGLAVNLRRGMRRILLSTGHVVQHPVGRLGSHRSHGVIRTHVLANGLQTLQDGLPLCPIKLPQVRSKSLNERIFQNRFSVRFRYEEAIQSYTERFSDFFERAETGGHLPALDA